MEAVAGSHLYGTDTPASDRDYKGVVLPDAKAVLLGKADFVSHDGSSNLTAKRNTSSDTDREIFSLAMYLRLLAEGQTNAVEMLFAPDSMHVREPDPLWRELQAAAPRLVSRRVEKFYGYCRSQSAKYCAKAERMRAVEDAVLLLKGLEKAAGPLAKLGDHAQSVESFAASTEYCGVVDVVLQSGTVVRHLSVADRQTPYTSTVKIALDTFERQLKTYGQRAKSAQLTDDKDWKSLSHAVRIGREAVELFETGKLVLPRPDAPDLLAIKKGLKPYDQVLDEVDSLLSSVLNASERSSLPDEVDSAFLEDFLMRAHRAVVEAG